MSGFMNNLSTEITVLSHID